MITKTIAAGLVALTTLSAVPANASGINIEFGGPGSATMTTATATIATTATAATTGAAACRPTRSAFMLRRDGYRNIRFFDDRGPVYQLRASKHGRDFFLVVSARSGEILSRQRI